MNRSSFRPLLAVCSLLVLPPAGLRAASPYPPSAAITGISFDWSTHDERAPGSDNWPITWADDGHQYTSWGDGGGFGGTNSDGRVSLGVGRVEGAWNGYQGFNVWGGKDPENPAQFGGKSYGILSLGGILYMWWGPGSGTTSYTETRLLISTDRGATWTKSSWDFTDIDGQLIMPTLLNFGQDYTGARDGYVYHYFIRKEPTGGGLGIHQGGNPATGKIDLARVPTGQLMMQTAYEFFAGFDGGGDPVWTSDALQRQPVFQDPNGVGWNVSVSYNEPLGRYLLATEHTDSLEGNLGLFDAPEPWGPWTTVRYCESPEYFGSDVGHPANTFYWSFANKWLSLDGKTFSMVFTGIGSDDSWNTIRGTFSTPGGGPSHTLTLDKTGQGTGTVTSSPGGISCGAICQATFTQNTLVTLTADPDAGSVFSGWSGDPDCLDGMVTMNQDHVCSAGLDPPPTGFRDLVGYWALDEATGTTAADSTSPAENGTLTNMEPGSDWVDGSLGPALEFDGTNEYVEVGDSDELDLAGPDLTVAAWIKPDSFGQSSQGRVVDHGGGSSGSGGWTFQLMDNGSFVQDGLAVQLNGNSIHASDADVVTLQSWQHVAVVQDSGTLTFFVDGQPRGTRTGVPAITPRAAPVRIGIRATDLNRGFDGVIDEVRIYRRALAQTEIEELAAPCLGSQDLLIENQSLAASQVFEACNTISAGPGVVVEAGADVAFEARKTVTLRVGFQVDTGALFTVGIHPTAGSS